MPKVTAVKGQRNKKRLNIYLDEVFAFGIDRELWFGLRVKVGDELSDEEIEQYKNQGEKNRVFDKLLHFISYRPRSKKETLKKLSELTQKYNLSEEEATEIEQKLERLKYIDDVEFGRWWMAQRKKQGKGKKVVTSELYQKGLDSKLIERLVGSEELAGEEEARKLLIKNRWRYKASERENKKKMQEMLLRRGFTWEEVKKSVEDFLD